MPKFNIRNLEVDQEAVELATRALTAIPQHWRALLPETTIMVVRQPFNRIPEIREFCEMQEKQSGWEESHWESVEAICPEFDEKGSSIWVRYFRETSYATPEYYFQKHLYEVVAKLLWMTSKMVRGEALRLATGRARDSEAACYLAFRDTFSRLFLNPEYLKERRPDAWSFVSNLDRALAFAVLSK